VALLHGEYDSDLDPQGMLAAYRGSLAVYHAPHPQQTSTIRRL